MSKMEPSSIYMRAKFDVEFENKQVFRFIG